jgi:lysozyme family protein
MTTLKFRRCHAVTAKWEGGWSDHKADPGGKTMYGITEAVYHAWLRKQGRQPKPVRSISREVAEEIFFTNYWQAAKCDRLAPGVDLSTYDASVNSGVSRGRKWLLSSIGGRDDQTVKRMCATRLAFVRGLSTWSSFGRGWSNRIADIEKTGVAWAREPSPELTLDFPPIVIPPLPERGERGNFLLDLIRFIWSKIS